MALICSYEDYFISSYWFVLIADYEIIVRTHSGDYIKFDKYSFFSAKGSKYSFFIEVVAANVLLKLNYKVE